MFKKYFENLKLQKTKLLINSILSFAKKHKIKGLTYDEISYLFGYNNLKYGYDNSVVEMILFEKSPSGLYNFEIYSYNNDDFVSETDEYQNHTCLKYDEYKKIYKYLKAKYHNNGK